MVFGDVTINNSADITALGGDGIRGQNYGVGNITVTDAPNVTITAVGDASSRYGIYAQNLGPVHGGTKRHAGWSIAADPIEGKQRGLLRHRQARAIGSSGYLSDGFG